MLSATTLLRVIALLAIIPLVVSSPTSNDIVPPRAHDGTRSRSTMTMAAMVEMSNPSSPSPPHHHSNPTNQHHRNGIAGTVGTINAASQSTRTTRATTTTTTRRGFMLSTSSAGLATTLSPILTKPSSAASTTTTTTTTTSSGIVIGHDNDDDDNSWGKIPFEVYRVFPDASPSLNPHLKSINRKSLLKDMLQQMGNTGGAIWLGEHHNSKPDHVLQASLIRDLYNSNKSRRTKMQTIASSSSSPPPPPMAIGLEQVQMKFQPVLQDFVEGKISMATMKDSVEWDSRWQWPFEVYEPIFATAQELGIELIALNVDSEDLSVVETKGLPGLDPAVLRRYIPDARGFSEFAQPIQFKTYVDYVIRPSYELHQAMGILRYNMAGEKLPEEMSFRNFFSARILWDEAMASRAHQWSMDHEGGILVGLVGADHVKFVNGIVGRYARLAGASAAAALGSANTTSSNKKKDMSAAVRLACVSVMLNPTLTDTRPSGSVSMMAEKARLSQSPDQITLQLRYVKKDGVNGAMASSSRSNTGGVMPLSDYVVIGGDAERPELRKAG